MKVEWVVVGVVVALAVGVPVRAGSRIEEKVARVVMGECGGRWVWGGEERARRAWELVAWVVRNRIEAGMVGEWSEAEVEGPPPGFYGWAEEVEEEVLEVAELVFGSMEEEDPTGGARYVISEQDREELGFPEGDLVLRGRGPFVLHFYKEWPEEVGDE